LKADVSQRANQPRQKPHQEHHCKNAIRNISGDGGVTKIDSQDQVPWGRQSRYLNFWPKPSKNMLGTRIEHRKPVHRLWSSVARDTISLCKC